MKSITKTDIPMLSLKNSERWSIVFENNQFNAYDSERLVDFLTINEKLKIMHTGLLLGELKGSDFIPSASIALSKKLNKDSVEVVDVDYRTAISYLKKEAIYLPDSNKGYFLISYKSQSLGWVKNLGNRCNNLYPQEWRIRMKL